MLRVGQRHNGVQACRLRDRINERGAGFVPSNRAWRLIRALGGSVTTFSLLIAAAFVIITACEGRTPSSSSSRVGLDVPTGRANALADVDADSPVKKLKRFQPLADYLASDLAEFGISRGIVRIAPDLDTLIGWMSRGEVDLYFDSVFPATIVADRADALPVLRRWRNGVGEYHSIIFARADAGLREIGDLRAKTVALDEPYSTSGYPLPLSYLIKAGLTPAMHGINDRESNRSVVGYVFSGDDDNTVQWVISGKVDAGAVDNQTYAGIPGATRNLLSVVAETESVPRQAVMARKGLEPELLAADRRSAYRP